MNMMNIGDQRPIKYHDRITVVKCLFIKDVWYFSEPFEDSLEQRYEINNMYLRDYLGQNYIGTNYATVLEETMTWGD